MVMNTMSPEINKMLCKFVIFFLTFLLHYTLLHLVESPCGGDFNGLKSPCGGDSDGFPQCIF